MLKLTRCLVRLPMRSGKEQPCFQESPDLPHSPYANSSRVVISGVSGLFIDLKYPFTFVHPYFRRFLWISSSIMLLMGGRKVKLSDKTC